MSVRVIGVGELGHAIAAELDGALSSAPESLPEAGAALQVLAAWRPVPRLFAALDEWAFRTGGRWLPVVAEPPWIRVGPAVVPGHGACHGCYVTRVRQHDPAPELLEALDRHYERHPDAGPGGFLPALATLTAGVALGALERLAADPAAAAGRVQRFDAVHQRMTRGRVVGVHGCPRCGLHRDERARSCTALAADLAEALG